MPAKMQFQDMTATCNVPSSIYVPIPIPTGPNWQPNDIRICCAVASDAVGTNNYIIVPPGYTSIHQTAPPTNQIVSYRRLQPGDTDTFVQYTQPSNILVFVNAIISARGASLTSAPTAGTATVGTLPASSTTGGTVPVTSVTVPSAGTMVLWFWAYAPQGASGQIITSMSIGCPAGWTNLVATDGSGTNFTPFNGSPNTMLVAKSFTSAGSTGTINVQYGAEVNAVLGARWIFIPAAVDVSATAGSAAAAATSAAATGGVTSNSSATAGSASTVATSSTAFNPLQGYWVSDPLTLPGDPVTGSVLRWAGNTPTGATALVETSINNGASWDAAVNNRSVPRLKPDDTVTKGVLVRISLTRTVATDPAPTMSYLELQVSTDSGTDELIPIGHGMIDKVTVKTVGGSTGSGSTVSSIGSSAVISKGGGQSGGGTSIKVHVTDLSRAIKRNQWQMPYVVPVGTNYGDAIKAMVLDRLLDQTEFAISTTTRTLDTALVYGMDQGGDPWQDIREVAMAIGFECYFDPRGVFVLRPVPDPRIGIPVFTFDENFNPVVVEASKQFSDEQTFNDIIITGQSSSTQNPVSAEAFDNDPSSRTYILGDYGRVVQRLPFNNVTTVDQAQDVANATLFNSLGAAETVTITNVPHFALEPGDVLKIKISNIKVDGTYYINSMTTPMSPAEAQQLVLFRQSTNA